MLPTSDIRPRIARRVTAIGAPLQRNGCQNGSMRKESVQPGARVFRIGGGAMAADAFEGGVYALFWKEASQAVAMSRLGRVHLIDKVDLEVLRALHEEGRGGTSAGKMPIVVVCKDFESLAGPMMRRIQRDEQGWRMGDGSVVRFFKEMPGEEEGKLSPPRALELSEATRADMRALAAAMESLAQRAAAEHA